MHAGLSGKLAKGKFANHSEGNGFNSRFFPILVVVDLRLESLPFRPSQIHTQQHVGPVLRFRSARAGMDRDDGIERVGLPGEHGAGFHAIDKFSEGGDFALQFGLDIFALAGELKVGIDFAAAPDNLVIHGEECLQAFALAHQHLRLRRERPDGGIGKLTFEVG